MSETILEVKDLLTVFHTAEAAWPAVNQVSFTIQKGEIVGLVGESGSGKSVTGFSLLGLIDPPGEIVSGSIILDGQELVGLDEEKLRHLRGKKMSMIFQDPLMTLNPVLKIKEQMLEVIEDEKLTKDEAVQRCIQVLTDVGIPSPEKRFDSYPHELSGGMRQRVCIAIALLGKPELIIADEPTTALDVTIQGQILSKVQTLAEQHKTALLWITHDLGVVAELADKVIVMYSGRIVESGPVWEVLNSPKHPYTQGLLASLPSANARSESLKQIPGMAPLLHARPSGCSFRDRCQFAQEICAQEFPPVTQHNNRTFSCFFPLNNGEAT